MRYEIKKGKSKIEGYVKDGDIWFKVIVKRNGKVCEDEYGGEK